MSETPQDVNLDELDDQVKEGLQEVIELSGEITNVRTTTVGEAYDPNDPVRKRELDFDDPTKPCIEVTARLQHKDEQVDITDVFPVSTDAISLQNSQNKLGRFVKKYGSVPEEDMQVQFEEDTETGFYRIDY